MRKYFVSYWYTKGQEQGVGNSTVELDVPVTGTGGIQLLADKITEGTGATNVVILFWRNYEQPE